MKMYEKLEGFWPSIQMLLNFVQQPKDLEHTCFHWLK
jgi:hypothetical protein